MPKATMEDPPRLARLRPRRRRAKVTSSPLRRHRDAQITTMLKASQLACPARTGPGWMRNAGPRGWLAA